MKRILLAFFVLLSFSAGSQVLQKPSVYGYQFRRMVVDTLFAMPSDTFTVPATLRSFPFVARKGTTLYFWNTSTHVWASGAGAGTVTSVGLSMPSAFSVANSPVTGAGTLAVTGSGTTSQYVRGDGSLGSSLATALHPTWQQTLTAGSRLTTSHSVSSVSNNFVWDSLRNFEQYGYTSGKFKQQVYNSSSQSLGYTQLWGNSWDVSLDDPATGGQMDLSANTTAFNMTLTPAQGSFWFHNSKESTYLDQVLYTEGVPTGGKEIISSTIKSNIGHSTNRTFFTKIQNQIENTVYNQIYMDSATIGGIHIGTKRSAGATYKGIKIDLDHQVFLDSTLSGASTDSVLVRNPSTGKVGYRNASAFGGTYTFTNGLTESGGTVKLGGTLVDATTTISGDGKDLTITNLAALNIDGTESSNIQIASGGSTGQINIDGGNIAISGTRTGATSIFKVEEDSVVTRPHLGAYYIDSLNYTLSTTGKKIMLRDTATGLVQNIDPSLLGGGGLTVGATAIASGTAGRVLFEGSGNVLQEDDSYLYNTTDNRLTVGQTTDGTGTLNISRVNTDYTNTSGAGSVLFMNNTSATGQTVIYSQINSAMNFKVRGDYTGNMNWISAANATTSGHNFYVNGDYPGGTIRLAVFRDGVAVGKWIAGTPSAPTALLHLMAGTATASTAPLKFTVGGAALTTAAVDGQMEVLVDSIYYTGNNDTRNRLAYTEAIGSVSEKQGADVASVAGAIVLGSDGNTFEITGTNAITLISNVRWQNGSEINLVFTSTATLTDGTANSGTDIGLELAGNANFTASADDIVTLVLSEVGGTQRWREKCRSVN